MSSFRINALRSRLKSMHELCCLPLTIYLQEDTSAKKSFETFDWGPKLLQGDQLKTEVPPQMLTHDIQISAPRSQLPPTIQNQHQSEEVLFPGASCSGLPILYMTDLLSRNHININLVFKTSAQSHIWYDARVKIFRSKPKQNLSVLNWIYVLERAGLT